MDIKIALLWHAKLCTLACVPEAGIVKPGELDPLLNNMEELLEEVFSTGP
jgi:hypothetical protein